MDLLPEECLDNIVSYLDVVSLTRLGLSSTRLRTSCFSPRYWTNVDLSSCHAQAHIIDADMIKHLSKFATEMKILNIQKCILIKLEAIIPFVFLFKSLELIKHDGQHRLLDETVAINRMLNNADKLIAAHRNDSNLATEEGKAKFDNAVRQARALIWDALFIVAANKRGTKFILKNEASFDNIKHPQETLELVMKKLHETEDLLQQPVKLWSNMTLPSAIKGASFVIDPRTQKVYLACGALGEIVIWDLDTQSIFKVFNYLESLDTIAAKNVRASRTFISVLLFKHMDRVMLLGGTSRGAVCWDYDTKQIVYQMTMPSKPGGDYLDKYYASSWHVTDKGEGMIMHYQGAFLFDLGTGEFGKKLTTPKGVGSLIWSTKNNGLALSATKPEGPNVIALSIINMFTEEKTKLFQESLPPTKDDDDDGKNVDWFEDRLIALLVGSEVLIYKNESTEGYDFKLLRAIMAKTKVHKPKILSDELLLLGDDVYSLKTGLLAFSLDEGSRGNTTLYSPELNMLVRIQHNGVSAIYKDNKKIGPEPSVLPLCAISKLTDDTVMLHGNYSTFASFVNYHGRNYAKYSIKEGKILEIEDTPLQVLDVSSDGKYALAQDKFHGWKDRHDVFFNVFEVETKKVVFEKKFLQDRSEATWYVSPVGRCMPKHPHQVLLAHPQSGFQIFDVMTGEMVADFFDPSFDGVEDHIKISQDERYVLYKTVRQNMGCNAVVDLHDRKVYNLSGHSNTADSLGFNPVNPTQVVTAGCGIRVFNLPDTQNSTFYVTRHLDGLVQTVRESEEIACLKFSPDGKYLAALDLPSRGPWGLEIANTLIRVYETTNFTLVSSFDTGGQARALYWLDNERAIVGLVNGKVLTLQLVVKEYRKLFEYIVPSQHKTK